MTNDFDPDFAADLIDYLSQGVDLPVAPDPLYVTLYDDTGAELNASLQNGRVSTTAGTDWTVTNTAFENANQIDFGEATADVTIQQAALKDGDDTDANTTVLVKGDVTDAPQSFASGTQVLFEAGQFTFDVLD